jgi:hypothetical protein
MELPGIVRWHAAPRNAFPWTPLAHRNASSQHPDQVRDRRIMADGFENRLEVCASSHCSAAKSESRINFILFL